MQVRITKPVSCKEHKGWGRTQSFSAPRAPAFRSPSLVHHAQLAYDGLDSFRGQWFKWAERWMPWPPTVSTGSGHVSILLVKVCKSYDFPKSIWTKGSSNSGGLLSYIYIFTSSPLHIFTSTLIIFTSSHLHLSSSHLHIYTYHLHIFTSTLIIFTSSHLHLSSSHLHIYTYHLHIFTSTLIIFTSSHLHLSSSHLHIYTYHLHIFTSTLIIFTSSHLHLSSSHLHIYTYHLHIFTSTLIIFTSIHLHIFSPSLSLSLPLSLSLLFRFSRKGPGAPTRRHEMTPFSHENVRSSKKLRWIEPFRTKWGSSVKNCFKIASLVGPGNPFAGSSVKNWGFFASLVGPAATVSLEMMFGCQKLR